MNRQKTLIWIDLEMTGLSPENNVIIEIASIATDYQLNEIAVGPVLAIFQPESELAKMDKWNQNQHNKSGLINRVRNSSISNQEAQQQTLEFIKQHSGLRQSPMCGNSICTDRRFLAKHMPELEKYFHYRNLDVSTLKIIAELWQPTLLEQINKKSEHLALTDIRESIAELRHYRQHLLAKPSTAK